MEKIHSFDIHEKRMLRLKSLLKYLPSACNDFIRSISTTTSELTRLAYAMDYKIFFEFLVQEIPRFSSVETYAITDDLIASITTREFDIFIDYLKFYVKEESQDLKIKKVYNSENGIMRKLSSLRSLFGYLFRMERIPGNTAELIPLPKLPSKPILFMSDEEVSEMIDIILNGTNLSKDQKKYNLLTRTRDYALIMLFLGTGMRISECVGIDVNDIDLKLNAVLVTRKGGNSEILYYPEQVAEALAMYLSEREQIDPLPGHENAMFLSMQRKRITQRAVQLLVKKYATLAAPLKKRLSPHKLRSTYATNLYESTGDIYLVADALGHADVNTTRKHYASMSDQHRKQAAQNLKITKATKEENQ
ncbi:MAG: tyrosine-type recombinase/integrase [Eubacteriales bacterium]|nr:tyrosine-type recombinase/integrase [Eubacteriales bacterium]